MAEGFITRRGSPARYYETEMELEYVWEANPPVDVGFSPKSIIVYPIELTSQNLGEIRQLYVIFDENDSPHGYCETDGSPYNSTYDEESVNFPTVTRTATGITVEGREFAGTYRIIATG